VGLRPAVFGVNRIGLRRKGLDDDRIRTVEKAMRIFLRSGLNTTQALERLEAEFPGAPDVEYLIGFVRSAKPRRGQGAADAPGSE
jgi:UDP-N-acetylglucosamine acyltransferase